MKLNKLVACMSSLIQCFAAISGTIREKHKWILQGLPLKDILVKYVFELRRKHVLSAGEKKVLPAYCHFQCRECFATKIYGWDIDGKETEQNPLCLIFSQVQLKVNYFCLVLRLFTPDKRVGQLKLSPEPED